MRIGPEGDQAVESETDPCGYDGNTYVFFITGHLGRQISSQ